MLVPPRASLLFGRLSLKAKRIIFLACRRLDKARVAVVDQPLHKYKDEQEPPKSQRDGEARSRLQVSPRPQAPDRNAGTAYITLRGRHRRRRRCRRGNGRRYKLRCARAAGRTLDRAKGRRCRSYHEHGPYRTRCGAEVTRDDRAPRGGGHARTGMRHVDGQQDGRYRCCRTCCATAQQLGPVTFRCRHLPATPVATVRSLCHQIGGKGARLEPGALWAVVGETALMR